MNELPAVKALSDIYSRYGEDPAFSELRAKAHQLVQGHGETKDPAVVFVGEAPGAEEDASGVPFCGAAGKMLDRLMAGIQMSRRGETKWSVFITNIVKYRPESNRDPYPPELRASIKYLNAELALLNPKVVVTLGKHATQALWPEAPNIGRCHGVVRVTEQYLHMPMYHPAYGLYDPRRRDVLNRDFFLLARELENV